VVPLLTIDRPESASGTSPDYRTLEDNQLTLPDDPCGVDSRFMRAGHWCRNVWYNHVWDTTGHIRNVTVRPSASEY
jgi:hypothetical protein